MRIIVGTDGEASSRTAVDWLLAQPVAAGADVTLVTSFDLLVSDVVLDAARLAEEADRMRAARPDIRVDTALADGSIPEVLRRSTEHADLLVIGSHRTSRRRPPITGSLAQRLAAMATVPTVVVPEDWYHRDGDVVAGVADDASADDALEFAAAFAAAQARPLRLVHFWSRTPPATDPVSLYLSVPADQRDAHAARLREVADRVRHAHPDLEVVEHLQEGRPPAAFRSPDRTASVVVLGSHRRGPLAAWVLGSVAREELAAGGTAVAVVPPGTA